LFINSDMEPPIPKKEPFPPVIELKTFAKLSVGLVVGVKPVEVKLVYWLLGLGLKEERGEFSSSEFPVCRFES
jgi:hypothetical protein